MSEITAWLLYRDKTEGHKKILKLTLMESFPSSTMQISRSLCLKPKPFLEDPNSCSRAPVYPKTPGVSNTVNMNSGSDIMVVISR